VCFSVGSCFKIRPARGEKEGKGGEGKGKQREVEREPRHKAAARERKGGRSEREGRVGGGKGISGQREIIQTLKSETKRVEVAEADE
jgi:hypothetical protein